MNSTESLQIFLRSAKPEAVVLEALAIASGNISGLVCPVSTKRYLIYGQDADVMKKAREVIRRIASNPDDE